MKKDCRAFAAGMPKIPAAPRGAASLDQQPSDWEEDLVDGEGLSSLEPVFSIEEEETNADSGPFQAPKRHSGGSGEAPGASAAINEMFAKFFPISVLNGQDSDDEDGEESDFVMDYADSLVTPSDREPAARKQMSRIQHRVAERQAETFASPSGAAKESLSQWIA